MRRILIVLCATWLCGCSFLTKWTDVTGQGRNEAAAQADNSECYARAGYPEPATRDNAPTRAEVEAASVKFRACMTERGWRMDRTNRPV